MQWIDGSLQFQHSFFFKITVTPHGKRSLWLTVIVDVVRQSTGTFCLCWECIIAFKLWSKIEAIFSTFWPPVKCRGVVCEWKVLSEFYAFSLGPNYFSRGAAPPSGTLDVGCREIKNRPATYIGRHSNGTRQVGRFFFFFFVNVLMMHLHTLTAPTLTSTPSVAQNASDKLRSQSLQLYRTVLVY